MPFFSSPHGCRTEGSACKKKGFSAYRHLGRMQGRFCYTQSSGTRHKIRENGVSNTMHYYQAQHTVQRVKTTSVFWLGEQSFWSFLIATAFRSWLRKWLWIFTLRIFTYLCNGSHYPQALQALNSDKSAWASHPGCSPSTCKQWVSANRNQSDDRSVQGNSWFRKYCNVLHNLLLIRQWDYRHPSIACCTKIKHQRALLLNEKNKEADETCSAKAKEWASAPGKRSAGEGDLGKDRHSNRNKGLQINSWYTITIWQTLVLQLGPWLWRVASAVPLQMRKSPLAPRRAKGREDSPASSHQNS